MGWKNIKEHFGIKHIVQVEDGEILIGSRYASRIIAINIRGEVSTDGLWGANEELKRCLKEIKEDPDTVKALIDKPDVFEKDIEVFTFKGDQIISCHCETLYYPNVTHDGRLMYENMFTTDRNKVVDWAREALE